MIVPEKPETCAVHKKISVNEAAVAVAQRQLGGTLGEGIVAINIVARLVADRAFILAATLHKEVVLHERVCGRQAAGTVTNMQRGGVVGLTRPEIEKVVMMYPGALRHSAGSRSL